MFRSNLIKLRVATCELELLVSVVTLDGLWQPAGYFAREPNLPEVRIAFANYGVSIGLQSVQAMRSRVGVVHDYFERHRSEDEYDRAAITHVMACSAHFPGHLIDFPK